MFRLSFGKSFSKKTDKKQTADRENIYPFDRLEDDDFDGDSLEDVTLPSWYDYKIKE